MTKNVQEYLKKRGGREFFVLFVYPGGKSPNLLTSYWDTRQRKKLGKDNMVGYK
jgi:hypothetical protein